MATITVPQLRASDKNQGRIEIHIPPLISIFAQLRDWRKARGKVYRLLPLIAVLLVGLMCDKKCPKRIARWCRALSFLTRARLGLPFGRSPSAKTLDRLLAKLPPAELEQAIFLWQTAIQQQLIQVGLRPRLALDGKTLRGAAKRGGSPVHLLAAVCHDLKVVVTELAVDSKTNEIPVALPLLHKVLVEGCVVTMDALLTQREIAQTILDGRGDYLMVVKDNQPQLAEDIALCFESEPLPTEVRGRDQLTNKGHGRLEERAILTSAALKGYVNWPGAEQVLQITRTVTKLKTGAQTTEQVYAITSLAPERGSPRLLLELNRGQWAIESVHWVRDVTLGEDACAVHKGGAPQVLAAFRNIVMALLRLLGHQNIAAALDYYSARPEEAIRTIGLTTGL